jgi:MoxR-like ATPase
MALRAKLVPVDSELELEPLLVPEGKSILGRKEPAALVVEDRSISSEHAELELDGHSLLVRDLESTNGIYAGERRVRSAQLYDQDFVTFGNVVFRFETGELLPDILTGFKARIAQVRDELNRRIIGQADVIDQLLAAVFGGGHCLLIGVPGLAKTEIVKTLARVVDLSFRRVQFTPDLMPSDITGTHIISMEEGDRRMKFVEGPIFTQFLLADEINRTPPKTQAALLEAMQERQITSGTESRDLPDPFIVVATQNPIEQEGTYPLPEAQLDRFMFCVHVEYPTVGEEEEILRRTTTREPTALRKVLTDRDLCRYRNAITQVEAAPFVIAYAAALARNTRPQNEDAPPPIREQLEWGAGPRAGQYLIFGAKAFAAMDGRMAVSCADVRRCAIPVLRHRIALNFQAQAAGTTTDDVVRQLLALTPEPEVVRYE